MNEIEFRNWQSKKGISKKVQSDTISRLKRIERELNNCDLDEQYHLDRCESLMSLFSKMGQNSKMKNFSDITFPIGKYEMNTFKYALKKYVSFCEDLTHNTN